MTQTDQLNRELFEVIEGVLDGRSVLRRVEELLDAGADPNASQTSLEKRVSTPLTMAVFRDKKDLIELLLECGADVALKVHGRTALHFAAAHVVSEESFASVLKAATRADCVDEVDDNDETALFVAIKRRDFLWKTIELLEAGADPQIGRSALTCAVSMSKSYGTASGFLVRQLLAAGADPNTSPLKDKAQFLYLPVGYEEKHSLLPIAAENNAIDVIYALLEAGADPFVGGNFFDLLSDSSDASMVKKKVLSKMRSSFLPRE